MNIRFFSLLTAAGILLLTSCAKDDQENLDSAIASTDAVARTSDDAVEELVDELVFRSDSDEVVLPACVEVTDSGPGVYPRLVTLDFGAGCTDAAGRTRTGMMHVSISAPWTEVGSLREVTFEDFTVTRPMQEVAIGIAGSRLLERLDPGSDGESRWARNINTTLTHPDFTVDRTFSGIRRWVAGEGDPDADQIFGLTGSGSHARNGFERIRTILEEVLFDQTCGEPTAGVVLIDRPLLEDATLDYGDGSCDGVATLSAGGEELVIDL